MCKCKKKFLRKKEGALSCWRRNSSSSNIYSIKLQDHQNQIVEYNTGGEILQHSIALDHLKIYLLETHQSCIYYIDQGMMLSKHLNNDCW